MKFGVHLPILGPFSDSRLVLELAQQAEDAGRDGFFLWDHVAIPEPMIDSMTARAVVEPYAAAGVTWWLEDISPVRVGQKLGDAWPEPWPVAAIVERIMYGPPYLS